MSALVWIALFFVGVWILARRLDRYERRLEARYRELEDDRPLMIGLLDLDDEEPIIVTPRGVEFDLRGSDLELSDVLEHLDTIEAL